MSSIGGVTNNPAYLQQLASANASPVNDGDADDAGSSGSVQNQGASFAQSLQQALSQLGGSGSTSSSGNAQNAQVAVQTFLQQLLAALHQAGTGNASQQADGDGDHGVEASAAGAAHARHPHGGVSHYHATLQADLQSLMQQVSSSSAANSGLQQSFQSMLGAMGANGTNTLSGFLQSIAANMQGSSLLSTTA